MHFLFLLLPPLMLLKHCTDTLCPKSQRSVGSGPHTCSQPCAGGCCPTVLLVFLFAFILPSCFGTGWPRAGISYSKQKSCSEVIYWFCFPARGAALIYLAASLEASSRLRCRHRMLGWAECWQEKTFGSSNWKNTPLLSPRGQASTTATQHRGTQRLSPGSPERSTVPSLPSRCLPARILLIVPIFLAGCGALPKAWHGGRWWSGKDEPGPLPYVPITIAPSAGGLEVGSREGKVRAEV